MDIPETPSYYRRDGKFFPYFHVNENYWHTPVLDTFYKTKDGEHCAEKTLRATRFGLVAGSFYGVFDAFHVDRRPNPTYLFYGVRVLHYALPAGAMMAAYASTSCIAGQIRSKDDSLNHGIGGAVAGSVLGTKYGMAHGYRAAFVFGLVGMIVKQVYLQGGEFTSRPSIMPTRNSWFGGGKSEHIYSKGQHPLPEEF